jgi:toxin ParE1/3/4
VTSPATALRGSPPSKARADELLPFPQAEAQLDDIWLDIAQGSGSIDTATRIVQNVGDRFRLLAKYPRMGRQRSDLSPELRSFAAAGYVIVYSIEKDEDGQDAVHIHYVFRGGQDMESFFHH